VVERELWRSIIGVCLTFAVIACHPGNGDPSQAESKSARPVPMTDSPAGFLRDCLETRLLRHACPRRVPITERPFRGGVIDFGTQSFAALDMRSAPNDARPGANRPPRFVHIAVEAGTHAGFRRLAASMSAVSLRGSRTWRGDPDERLRRDRRRSVLLATPRRDGRRGSLLLFPGYPVGGVVGDHLLFLWKDPRGIYALSRHAWSPMVEAVATLEAMVESVSANEDPEG
jgi:hypothetical protein